MGRGWVTAGREVERGPEKVTHKWETTMKEGAGRPKDLQGEHCGPEGQQRKALRATRAQKANEWNEASMAEGEGRKAGNEVRGRLEPVHAGLCRP